ncbi:DUF1398 family protein [Pedobacter aquatilis]|nr:DUF1398 family protein [Pedobacter aquatilis]
MKHPLRMDISDFLQFIKMCATCGIEKWLILINKMKCT